MPRYLFSLGSDGTWSDDIGVELSDDASAQHEALRTLPAIIKDDIFKGGDEQGCMILVRDENGAPVFSASLRYVGMRLR